MVSGEIDVKVGFAKAVIASPFTVKELVAVMFNAEISPAVVTVSPASPIVNVVPVLGDILFTFTSLTNYSLRFSGPGNVVYIIYCR